MEKPIIYLLCGLTGSGKTTYAKDLEEKGLVRLSLDEAVFGRYGRYGVDYPEDKHLELEEEIRKELDDKLIKLIQENKSVVLDYGLWARKRRDYYKNLVSENGGEWKLLYFRANIEELRRRLLHRNNRIDANALPISEEMLNAFIKSFEEPKDEGEEIIKN